MSNQHNKKQKAWPSWIWCLLRHWPTVSFSIICCMGWVIEGIGCCMHLTIEKAETTRTTMQHITKPCPLSIHRSRTSSLQIESYTGYTACGEDCLNDASLKKLPSPAITIKSASKMYVVCVHHLYSIGTLDSDRKHLMPFCTSIYIGLYVYILSIACTWWGLLM